MWLEDVMLCYDSSECFSEEVLWYLYL